MKDKKHTCHKCKRTENLKYITLKNGSVFLCFAHYGWYNQIKKDFDKVCKYLKIGKYR